MWDMTPLEWLNALTLWSIIFIGLDVMLLALLEKASIPSKLYKQSFIGYTGISLGWLVMKIGISLTSLNIMVKVSILGWFILLPMVIFTGINVLRKLNKPKNTAGQWIIAWLKRIFTFAFKICSKLLIIVSSLLAVMLVKALKQKNNDGSVPNYRTRYANPLNKTNPGIHRAFPNNFHRNNLDLTD